MMRESMFYEKKDQKLICHLCPHNCIIKEGQKGRCRVRENISGKLYSANYNLISAIQIDPIEKKPIMNWMPGIKILSIGSYGCNFHCNFCQNHSISLSTPETIEITAKDIVEQAISLNLPAIAYTYNEPTVFYEMMYETAKFAKEKGLKNVIVTNGFINKEPLLEILPYIDAMNIDLKTYNDENYKKLGGNSVNDILETIKLASVHCHVEVTILMVPKIVDDIEAFEKLIQKLYDIAPDVVIHLSRYFPRYHYDEPATSITLMQDFKAIVTKYFKQVYLGNVRE